MNQQFASYPFLAALTERRSRRFCLGMHLSEGPLAYQSRFEPAPLNGEEEGMLAFAACGITGAALADLTYGSARAGGNIMAGLAGRTISSGDGIQTVALAMINDDGAWLYRRPQDLENVSEIVALARGGQWVEASGRMRVRLSDQRVRVAPEPIFNLNVNRWSIHAPGTTYFLPINELTFMYINGLLEVLNEASGLFILDERAGFRPAGLGRFARSKGGHLDDDPAKGRVATIALVERLVTEFVTVEQGMMLQNLGLMAQTLGLGGFPSFANHDFAWFEALGFTMQRIPASKYLGVRGIPGWAMKLLGKDTEVPLPVSLERNGECLLRTYAPPHFPNMRAAVRAVVETKFGSRGVFRDLSRTHPWKGAHLGSSVDEVSPAAIEATIAYCEYVWERYGRFPATMPPYRTVLGFQAGHLDLEFYERFYKPEAIGDPHRADQAELNARAS